MMIMMAILVGNLKPNNPTENMFMPPFYLFMMMMKMTIILMVMVMVILKPTTKPLRNFSYTSVQFNL